MKLVPFKSSGFNALPFAENEKPGSKMFEVLYEVFPFLEVDKPDACFITLELNFLRSYLFEIFRIGSNAQPVSWLAPAKSTGSVSHRLALSSP